MKTATKSKTTKTPKDTSTPDSMNVLEILHRDHQNVAEMFFQYSELEKDDTEGKDEMASLIIKELFLHAKVEEELVYPVARHADDAEDMMDEADTEHHVVKFLLGELSEMSAEDDHFDSKICVLGELVNHHVQEEEKEIFEKLRESKADLEALGEKLIKRKEALAKNPMPKGTAIITTSKNGAKKK